MDASTCKEQGNAAMAVGDYVDALKWYSKAIALSPKDGALYSNRSFCFLKLGLVARALIDADDAVRWKPNWAKGHFRRAAALTHAGLHEKALQSYISGASIDPSDEHLRSQCDEAVRRAAAAKQQERMQVGGAAIAVALLLAFMSFDGAVGAAYLVLALLCGTVVGALGGGGFVLFRRQQRESSVLPPLQSNHDFAALQMKGDKGGAGELRAAPPPPAEDHWTGGVGHGGGGVPTSAVAGGSPSGAPAAPAKQAPRRSTQNGRAAAMKAKREGKI